MKNLIYLLFKHNLLKLLMLCVFIPSLIGCSALIPRITMDTPNTLPQSLEKSKTKFKCAGKIVYYPDGSIKSCSKGYYSSESSYNKQERKMTIIERIKSFVNNLVGKSFWLFVILLFLCPSLIGLIAGRILEGSVGITGQALKATMRAISRFKRTGSDIMQELKTEHSRNKNVQKKINKLRAEEN